VAFFLWTKHGKKVCVILPPSFGKGKMQVLVSLAALRIFGTNNILTQCVSHVHTQQECLREKSDHCELIESGPFKDRIEYTCEALDPDQTGPESTLHHLDEFDADVYADPDKFAKFFQKVKFCVGWTAAIDEKCSRLEGYLEKIKMKKLTFDLKCKNDWANIPMLKEFKQRIPSLEVAPEFIFRAAQTGPVVVFCERGAALNLA
jgi:hypothetical protein